MTNDALLVLGPDAKAVDKRKTTAWYLEGGFLTEDAFEGDVSVLGDVHIVGDHDGTGVVCHALRYGLQGVCIPGRGIIQDARGGKE